MEREVGALTLVAVLHPEPVMGSIPGIVVSTQSRQVGDLIEFLVLGGDIDERKEGAPCAELGCNLGGA